MKLQLLYLLREWDRENIIQNPSWAEINLNIITLKLCFIFSSNPPTHTHTHTHTWANIKYIGLMCTSIDRQRKGERDVGRITHRDNIGESTHWPIFPSWQPLIFLSPSLSFVISQRESERERVIWLATARSKHKCIQALYIGYR